MDPAAWIKAHKTAAAVGGVGGVAGLALLVRSRKASKSSSAGPTLGTSASASPGLTGTYAFDSSAMDTYNQLSSIISDQNDRISSIQAELAGNAVGQVPPSTGSGVVAPAAQPGFGTINTSQGEMVILGKETTGGPQGYSGYDVGGGAPVFYGNATDLSQGSALALPGNYVYTPAEFASQVTKTPDR